MADATQSFERHAKLVPLYHYWATGLLLIPTIYFLVRTVTDFSVERLMMLAFAMGTVLIGLFARVFPLGVQDRVIRLEERLRMDRLLPEDLRERAAQLETEQLIGLRFASDDELEELTLRCLEGELGDRKAVKRAVRVWRADFHRI